MQTLADIRALLEARGLAPRKALGQNFLIDKNLIAKLIDAAELSPGGLVLEVGPGTGTLSTALLARGCELIACELDRGLAQLLREHVPTLGLPGRFTLIEGDALEDARTLNPAITSALGGRPFRLVANLPYGAATPLLITLLAEHPACDRAAVTIQKEVADRLAARPGSKDYGTLGIVAQAVAEVTPIAKLPPECFWPRPEVTSAMVLLRRRERPLTTRPLALARFCQRLFSARRKQLGSTLGREHPWPEGVRPEQRPEELTPAQFIALAEIHEPGS